MDLRRALLGDRPPPGALSAAGTYDEANDKEFLTRPWSDLYPNENVPHH